MRKTKLDSAVTERREEELEKEYETENKNPENLERLDKLRIQISGLLGKDNLNLLREYTDRLIECCNADTGWFYLKGLEDGRRKRRQTANKLIGTRNDGDGK